MIENEKKMLARMLELQSDLLREWGEEEIAADLLERSKGIEDPSPFREVTLPL